MTDLTAIKERLEDKDDFDFVLARQVHSIASLAKDSEGYWIATPKGEYGTNNGSDWCEEHGFFMFRHLRKKDRKRAREYYFDGGWTTESDTHRFCAHCGCWLRVSLTDHGVSQELDHYRENGINCEAIIDEAYSIDLLMKAASWGSPHAKEVQDLARDLVSSEAGRSVLLTALAQKEKNND